MQTGFDSTVIDRITVVLNTKEDRYEATFSNLGIKNIPRSGVDMISIDNQQMIRENISNKKILKAIIADLYEDKKVKNLMSLRISMCQSCLEKVRLI